MSPTERLLDLVAFFLSSRRPVPVNDIFAAFEEEYAGSRDTRDRKFGRDKEALRELGIPLVWSAPAEDDEEGGYSIDQSAFYLPDISLAPDERAALFAVGAEASKSAFPLHSELVHALTKLRATHEGGEERAQPALFATSAGAGDIEEVLARAVTERRQLKFAYSPDPSLRLFDPYAFSKRRSRFAVVGYCHLRQGIRTFYADRITDISLASPSAKQGEFEVPPDFDPTPHLPRLPWQVRVHAPLAVDLEFSPELAESGPLALGIDPSQPCVTTHLDGLVSQVLALGPGVRIRGPEAARARARQLLAPLAAGLGVQS
jgi:proteasome accessory factor B